MRTQKERKPFARVPIGLLLTDTISPMAKNILIWGLSVDGKYKLNTKKKLCQMWKNYKVNQITTALQELIQTGLLERSGSGKYKSWTYRFAQYGQVEKFSDLAQRKKYNETKEGV